MTILERYDAAAPVSGPPVGDRGDLVDSLRDDCGVIVGRAAWLVQQLTGRDLLAELLEPIAGDFTAISAAQQGWLRVGEASAAVAANFDSVADQLPDHWEGDAAESCRMALRRFAAAHREHADGAQLVAEQLGLVLDAGELAARTVCEALAVVDGIVATYAVTAAAPVAGQVVGTIANAHRIKRLVGLVDRGRDAIRRFQAVVHAAATAMPRLAAGLAAANAGLSILVDVVDGADTALELSNALSIDDTAESYF